MSNVHSRDMYLAEQWLNATIGGVSAEGLYRNKLTSLAKLLGDARKEEYEGVNARVAHLEEALQDILRNSNDGESMATAAEALGVPLDRTNG